MNYSATECGKCKREGVCRYRDHDDYGHPAIPQPLVVGGQGRSDPDVWWSAVVVCVAIVALASWNVWT